MTRLKMLAVSVMAALPTLVFVADAVAKYRAH